MQRRPQRINRQPGKANKGRIPLTSRVASHVLRELYDLCAKIHMPQLHPTNHEARDEPLRAQVPPRKFYFRLSTVDCRPSPVVGFPFGSSEERK